MFTGLIKDIGKIIEVKNIEEGKILKIQSKKLVPLMKIDDSVATNGVCLTVIAKTVDSFDVQAIHTTLSKTNLGSLIAGSNVNLELALLPTERLGGHFVQGHINTVGSISNIEKCGQNIEVSITYPKEYRKYILAEGSIAIDGISLTVSAVAENGDFTVSIIPHTYKNTTLSEKSSGDSVNIEVDMLAKYIENIIKYR